MNPIDVRGTTATLGSCLLGAARPFGDDRLLRRLQRQAAWPVALVAALLALWSSVAPLEGAVIAEGQVQAMLGRKQVQHQEGGIVRAVHVRPGQAVKRGEPLLVVADLRSDAQRDLLREQHDAARLRAARAAAELALAADYTEPDGLAVAAERRQSERAGFDARRQTLAASVAALQAQIRDGEAQAAALQAQLQAGEQVLGLAHDELAMNAALEAGGFISKARLLPLERSVADGRGRTASLRGQLAELRRQLGALQGALADARGRYRQRAADDLHEAETAQRETADRLRPTEDLVERQTVRAPVDGTVMALRVSAPGTAVGPREPLLEIAPSDERLVVEVRLDPHDLDHVRLGQPAAVRLAAYDARRTRLLDGVVTQLAPDASPDPLTRLPRVVAQIEVAAQALDGSDGLRLQAGMPAEVHLATAPRSLLAYLLEPLGAFASRALREP